MPWTLPPAIGLLLLVWPVVLIWIRTLTDAVRTDSVRYLLRESVAGTARGVVATLVFWVIAVVAAGVISLLFPRDVRPMIDLIVIGIAMVPAAIIGWKSRWLIDGPADPDDYLRAKGVFLSPHQATTPPNATSAVGHSSATSGHHPAAGPAPTR